jgi:hypothetical protein
MQEQLRMAVEGEKRIACELEKANEVIGQLSQEVEKLQ